MSALPHGESAIGLLERLLFFLLQLAVYFPYISPVSLPTDTQPYALVLALILLALDRDLEIPKLTLLLVPALLVSCLLLVGSRDFLGAFRSLVGYLSVFIITVATFNQLRKFPVSHKTIKASILVWSGVGFIQLVWNRDFLGFLISSVRTSTERGVTSLAVEPSYFGIICVFFILMVLLMQLPKRYLVLLVVDVVVFAQSSMVILSLGVFAIAWVFVENKRLFLLAVGLVVIGMFLLTQIQWATNSRVFNVLQRIATDPVKILLIDASINDRLFNIVFAFDGFFKNWGVPHGFDDWKLFVPKETAEFAPYSWAVSASRIKSTYGAALFELGVFGAVILWSFNLALRGSRAVSRKLNRTLVIFLNIFLLTAIPMAFPFLGFLFGLLMAGERKPLELQPNRRSIATVHGTQATSANQLEET